MVRRAGYVPQPISLLAILLLPLLLSPVVFRAKVYGQHDPFGRITRADTLRGVMTPLRSWYDVTYYHLDVRIDPDSQSVRGSNTIAFRALTGADTMQVDLAAGMEISGISFASGIPLSYRRAGDIVYIAFPRPLAAGSHHAVSIRYGGKPKVALMPPWAGGFTWAKDSSGGPWVTVTCQGDGASLWWPCKDHQSDEPDSMMISITVPPGLQNVSNGRLRATTRLADGWTRTDWFVSYPINTYNVTVNIGKFAHFRDVYRDSLSLDYYVLPVNLGRAKRQFTQVKPMMECFERLFGPYPFRRDGFKLVESPHLGMEHQSAVAYGNGYFNGARGRSSSPEGLLFDYIIIHESAHEWWGNSVTSYDIADMWIHESFGTYAEGLYVECLWGREKALRFINAKKQNVGNRTPIIGPYNVNRPGSGDMYDKGQLVLNTLRSVIDDDALWFSILRGLQDRYRLSVVTADSITQYISARAGKDLTAFFDQYLRNTSVPVLEVRLTLREGKVSARFRWKADVQGFDMPVKVTTGPGAWGWIRPTTSWQTTELDLSDPAEFRAAEDLFYIETSVHRSYVIPAAPPTPRRHPVGSG